MSSEPSTWTFNATVPAARMPLWCSRSSDWCSSAWSSWSASRAGSATPGRPSGPEASGSSSARWIVPASLGRSERTILRPARDPASMAPRSGATEVDVLAPTSWATDPACGNGLSRCPIVYRESDLGLSADSWGAGHHGRATRSLERVGNPAPTWHRANASSIRPDLGGVPASVGGNHFGLRLLHR